MRAGSLQELVYKQGQAGVIKASVTIVFNNPDPNNSPITYESKKQITVTQLSRLYGVTRSAVYKWLYHYSGFYKQKATLVVQMESESYKTQRLQQQVAEMERIIGQKQLEIDFLNKLFEIASEEVGYDLKKNFSPKLSNGTAANEKNTTTK